MAGAPVSLIRDHGEYRSHCGYCDGDETSVSYGMHADVLTVEAYQALLDRGWRRSGCWLYRPVHGRTCCQLLTIRLNVQEFRPNKDQRRVLRKWQAYLDGAPLPDQQQGQRQRQLAGGGSGAGSPHGGSPKRAHDWEGSGEGADPAGGKRPRGGRPQGSRGEGHGGTELGGRSPERTPALAAQLTAVQLAAGAPQPARQPRGQAALAAELAPAVAAALRAALASLVAAGELPQADYPGPGVAPPTAKQRRQLGAGVGLTSAFALAVAGRAGRALGRPRPPEVVAAALLATAGLPAGVAGQAARGHLNFSFDAAPGQAEAASGTAAPRPPGDQRRRQAPAMPRPTPRHFEVRQLPSGDASIPGAEFELYRRYQVLHHNDKPAEVTEKSFRRFLCESPLVPVPEDRCLPGGAPPGGFGSFHQQYWLDGRLVAVGVVDVLPRCLSSKYLFWEPGLGSLSLGKLTSLLEIEWVRRASEACPALRYYYLGYYIHTCHRMRYKGGFGPSDLLCPKAQCWVPLSRVRSALGQPGVAAIAEVPGALEGLGPEHRVRDGAPEPAPGQPSEAELGAAKLFIPSGGASRRGRVVLLGQLCEQGLLRASMRAELTERLAAWAAAVGPAWRTMLYCL